jgi:formylglycine-generating enzyme required for sulfatase activity
VDRSQKSARSTSDSAESTDVVVTQNTSLFEGPSSESPAIQILNRESTVTVTDRSGDWAEIALVDGTTGFVLSKLLRSATEKPIPVVGTYPRAVRPAGEFKDCDVCPQMIVLSPGRFMMGSPDSEAGRDDDEGPRREVVISRAFAVSKFEVTRKQFGTFVQRAGYTRTATSCRTSAEYSRSEGGAFQSHNPGFPQSDTDPAVCISWDDATAYVDWLTSETGKKYRLLTEAEWEYAARAGAQEPRYWGSDIGTQRANCDGCGSSWDDERTSPIGSFEANGFGLHDMLGNAWEWVADCYRPNYDGAPSDGAEPVEFDCEERVMRGGSWESSPRRIRAANRQRHEAAESDNDFGMRVARTSED